MSLLKQFVQLRDKLSDISYDNNQFVTLASGVSTDITTHEAQVDSIIGKFDNSNQKFTLINTISGDTKVINIGDLPDKLGDNAPGCDLAIGDWFATVSKSGDLYTCLSNITAKYSYSNRMTLTDLNAMIDASVSQVSNNNYGVEDLKQQLLTVSNNDGYVSGNSWLNCLSNWFKNGEQSADEGSPEMDTTKPFTITAIYTIVVAGIWNTLSAILLAVKNVFTVIVGIVTSLLGKLFSVLAGTTEGVTVDHDAPNDFVKGPLSYVQVNNILSPSIFHGRKIFMAESEGLTVFAWDDDDHTSMKYNTYLTPMYTTEEINVWLENNGWAVPVGESGWKATTSFSSLPAPNPSNSALFEYDNFRFFAAIAMDATLRVLNLNSLMTYLQLSGVITTDVGIVSGLSGGTGYIAVLSQLVNLGCKMLTNCRRGRLYNDNISFNTLEAAVHNYVQYVTNIAADAGALFGPLNTSVSISSVAELKTDYYVSNNITVVLPKYPLSLSPVIGWRLDGGSNVVIFPRSFDVMEEVNVLPTCFKYSMDSFTNAQMIDLAIWTAVITIAATVVTLKVSKAMRLKKIRKSITRTKAITDAKKAYEDDPTKENLDAYVHSVDKYNRLGKIFGWGSYDARNAWINDVESGSSDVSPVPMIDYIKNKTEDISLISENTTGIAQDVSTVDEKLDYIIRLIKG